MSSATPQSQLESFQRWIVLDSGALIGGTDSLYALGGLTDGPSGDSLPLLSEHERVKFFITPDVATEIRDARARERLQALDRLGCVVARAPSAEAVAEVARCSKMTGDYAVLSATDLRVLALTYMLEVERNGTRFLKEVEEEKVVGEIRSVRAVKFDDVERWEKEEEERKEREENEGDGWEIVTSAKKKVVEVKKKKKKNKKKKKKKASSADPENKKGLVDIAVVTDVADAAGEVAEITEVTDMKIDQRGGLEESVLLNSVVTVAEEAEHEPIKGKTHKPVGKGSKAPVAEPTDAAIPCAQLENMSLSNVTCFENMIFHPDVLDQTGALDSTTHELLDVNEAEDDDGEGWINAENLEEHLARDGGEEAMGDEDRQRVACVTTDFAMQNTMLQIGLKLLSVDGRRTIRQIRRFALRCQSCSTITRELQRKFCERCGNAAMHRVAFKVDKKGVARAFLNPKKRPILRGTKYSIPLPRGGRHNKDLILCEDQIDPVKQRRLEKQREKLNVDVLDPSSFYNAGARFNPHDRPLVVGYGRRNPNQVRPSSKTKR